VWDAAAASRPPPDGLRPEQDLRRREVGGNGHTAHVADLQQGLDVRLVRMGGQGIPEEHDGVRCSRARLDLPIHAFEGMGRDRGEASTELTV